MFENPSRISKVLTNIDDTIGVISINKNELNDEVISLINYLSNGQLDEAFWQSSLYPKHIFTEQFDSSLLITISEDPELDLFSKNFANERRICSLHDIFPN